MMTREEAIKNREDCLKYLEECGPKASPDCVEAVRWSVKALKALRPVSRESVEKAEWIWSTEDVYTCSSCGEKTHVDECMGNPIYNFCPFCMAPMTDEAVEMVMERMEALHGKVD
jgi:rubrerythrin